MTTEIFAQWRAEISIDLDAAHKEFAEAEAALADAEIGRRTARARAMAMKVALDRLIPEPSPWPTQPEPIANSLRLRVADYQQAERSAIGAVASATARIGVLRETIADYETALRQIDAITAPAQPADEDDTSDAVVAEAA